MIFHIRVHMFHEFKYEFGCVPCALAMPPTATTWHWQLSRLASLQVLCQCLPVSGPTSNIIIIIIMVTFKSKLLGRASWQELGPTNLTLSQSLPGSETE